MDGYMTCTHHYDFLGRFLALHQHGPEVHAALDYGRKKRRELFSAVHPKNPSRSRFKAANKLF